MHRGRRIELRRRDGVVTGSVPASGAGVPASGAGVPDSGAGADATRRMSAFAAGVSGRAITAVLVGYFDATLEGGDHIPAQGGALLVGNHGPFGVDSFVLAALVARDRGRYLRFLVEKNLARLPPFDAFFRAVAAIPGRPDRAEAALASGELLGVYPGGIDESLQHARKGGRPRWGTRAGFARVALRAKVPVVPVTGIGIDGTYRVVARERWIGRRVLGSPRYDLPLALGAWGTPLPRRVTMRFVAGPPIDPVGEAEDPDAVERLRAATLSVIEAELARSRRA